MSKKSWTNLYSNLLYKMGHDFLDIQYTEYLFSHKEFDLELSITTTALLHLQVREEAC